MEVYYLCRTALHRIVGLTMALYIVYRPSILQKSFQNIPWGTLFFDPFWTLIMRKVEMYISRLLNEIQSWNKHIKSGRTWFPISYRFQKNRENPHFAMCGGFRVWIRQISFFQLTDLSVHVFGPLLNPIMHKVKIAFLEFRMWYRAQQIFIII